MVYCQYTFLAQLGINDLAVVREALIDVCAKWYHIGVELRLPEGTLSTIRTQFSDLTDCLTEMCVRWLKCIDPPPTWDALANAVEKTSVGEKQLAQQLRKTYCQECAADISPGQLQVMSTNSSSAPAQSFPLSTSQGMYPQPTSTDCGNVHS